MNKIRANTTIKLKTDSGMSLDFAFVKGTPLNEVISLISHPNKDVVEELLSTIEGAANMMRGMLFDPSIPDNAKGAMKHKIEELDSIISNHTQP